MTIQIFDCSACGGKVVFVFWEDIELSMCCTRESGEFAEAQRNITRSLILSLTGYGSLNDFVVMHS